MLKHLYEKKEEIPEALISYYREEGGTFILDVDTNDKIQEYRKKSIEAMKERDALRKNIDAYGKLTPEEAKALLDEKEQIEHKELLKKGDVDTLITRERERFADEWNKKLEAIQAENVNLQKTVVQLKVIDELKNAATAALVRPEAIMDIVELATREWVLENGAAVRKRGQEVVLSGKEPGKNQSMSEYFLEIAQQKPFYFQPSSGSDGRPTGGHAAKVLRNPTPVELGRNAEAVAKGEIVVLFDGK